MNEYCEISIEEPNVREFRELVDKELKEKGVRGMTDEIDQTVRKGAEEGILTENACQGLFILCNKLYERGDLEGEDRAYFEQIIENLLNDVPLFRFVSTLSYIINRTKAGSLDDPVFPFALLGLRRDGYSYKDLKNYVHTYLTQEERQKFGKALSDNKDWVEDYLSLDKTITEFVDENFAGVESTPWTVEDGERETVNVLSAATEDFLKHGYIQNTVFISKGKEMTVLPMFFENEKEKGKVVNAVHLLSNKMNPDAIMTVGESWVSCPSKEQQESEEVVMPSEDPNRKEAIAVTVETPVAKWSSRQFFERDEEGSIILSELIEPERCDNMEGNLVFMNNK